MSFSSRVRRTIQLPLSPRAPLALALALFACALAAPWSPAQAQVDDASAASYWRRERERTQTQRPVVQRPTRMIRGVAPRPGFSRETSQEQWRRPAPAPAHAAPAAIPRAPAPIAVAPAPAPAPAAPAPPAATEAAAAPAGPAFSIAVLGDNVGQLLAQGLQETFAERANVTILRKTRENTGLVRDDYFDWVKAAGELLSGAQKIDVAVMLVGSNDRQAIREGAQSHDPRTPRWRELYAARAQAFANAFREKKVTLIWVGAPVMQNERLSAGLLELNEIYRETAEAAGATYVDTWEGFADERHRFTAFGPDINGLITRLRTNDGVHFTRAGARKLAYFLEGDLRRLMDRAAPGGPNAQETLTPAPAPNVAPNIAPNLAPAPEARRTPPAASPTPAAPARPDKGPVLPLTGAALSPGGELARPLRADPARDLATAPGEPPAGRADDFRWPRP